MVTDQESRRMSVLVWFDTTSDSLSLSDGEHYLEIPHWAREILRDEFEREMKTLKAENAKLRTAYIETLIDGALRELGAEAES